MPVKILLRRFSFFPLLISGLMIFSSAANAQSERSVAELTMRVDRLEAQLRELTGQIERLTFTLQNSGAQAAVSQPAPTPLATQHPNGAAPSSTLGAQQQVLAGQGGAATGPLDLSALIGASQGGAEFTNNQSTLGAPVGAQPQAGLTTPRQEYELAYGFILRGDYGAAESAMREFLSRNPSDPLVSDARFWLGETLFVRGDFRNAANEFLDAYTNFPQSAKAPDSLLKLGLSLNELGEREAACATYSELVRKYPAASPPVKDRVRTERKSAKCI
ncbi:MAG: tol-pal system protein YbgF [Hyphomicrobiales bacterium]|nr:MAG: tol-pal system protein YbgF [Hyphomicrobiales bacterium]